MAIRGTIKVGDTVTHEDWEGETREVVELLEMARDPRGNKIPLAQRPIVCKLDRPAFDKGYTPTSPAEIALYDRWMEEGLEVVHAGS